MKIRCTRSTVSSTTASRTFPARCRALRHLPSRTQRCRTRSSWRARGGGEPVKRTTAWLRGSTSSGGRIVHPGVAEAFGMACESLDGATPRAIERVRFKRLASNPDLALPARASGGAAGYDVRCCEGFRLLARRCVRSLGTGLVMELPDGDRVPGTAPIGVGGPARHHASQQSGHDRLGLSGRAQDPHAEPGPRARGDRARRSHRATGLQPVSGAAGGRDFGAFGNRTRRRRVSAVRA